MKINSRLKGLERQREKREQHKAKIEGREIRQDFPPLVLIALIIVGSVLPFIAAGSLVILVILFPLLTRKMVKWDFRTCIKLSGLIAIVEALTIIAYSLSFSTEISIIGLLASTVYIFAIMALIMYVGVFLVNMLQGKQK